MSFFDWSQNLDVGVDSMNNDHKRLLEIMNKLHDRSGAGATFAELNVVIDELAQFTVQHFAREEKYMEDIGYPGVNQHKEIHANLLKRFAFHREDYNKRQGPVPETFFRFLKQWLGAHIQGIDCEYGKHAKLTGKIAV